MNPQAQDDGGAHHDGLGSWLSYLAAHGSSMDPVVRRRVYALTLFGALTLIWLPVLSFLILSPQTYTSKFSLIMPVTGAGQSVNLESIGQATSSVTSPFSQNAVDPKVNYRAIAMSKPVLKAAAAAVELKESEFGKPKIKLVDQTALMNFELQGSSAEQAQAKAEALHSALQQRLEQLRRNEVEERERYTSASLEAFSTKLSDAQLRIVEFQKSARVVSIEQFQDITMGLEDSRRQASLARARLDSVEAQIGSLLASLGISQSQSRGLLALQQDAQFQQLLQRHAEAAALLAEHRARYGSNNFKLRDAREVEDGLRRQLHARAAALGATPDSSTAMLEALGRDSLSGDIIESLARLNAEASGLRAELATRQAQIQSDELRLREGISDATALVDLERKRQVALAVFTTALAKVDLGRSDNFASYPMLQILAPPTLPYKPDTLGTTLALAGGIAGTLFCVMGLLVLWFRKPFLQKILKSG